MHRDVKPGNLLRSRDGGQVKLADFGIAKAAEHSDMTKVGSVLGTAAYLSPEQARGEPAGPASDLYALGVVSYQLLAGRLPVRGGLADRPRAPAGRAARRRRCTSSTRQIPRAAVARRGARARARPGGPLRRRRRDGAGARATRCAAIAPEPTAATRALDADRGDADARAHRDHDAARAHAGRAAAPAPAGADRRAAARRPRRAAPPRRGPPRRAARGAPAAPLRALRTLLLVALLAAVARRRLRRSSTETGQRGVQLSEHVQGNVEQAVDEIQDLIDDNTR